MLAQLAPQHGWQIKYSLSFPDGPSGSIELLLSTAIEAMGEAGCHSATFGTSAATHLGKGSHQNAMKMKTLSAAYDAITTSFHLLTKPEFRAKVSLHGDYRLRMRQRLTYFVPPVRFGARSYLSRLPQAWRSRSQWHSSFNPCAIRLRIQNLVGVICSEVMKQKII